MSMDLKLAVDTSRFRGIMSLGDIHADLSAVISALQYAQNNHLFVVFIGDLIDGDRHPYEVVELTKLFLDEHAAALTLGNHEHKMYRHATGEKIRISGSQEQTWSDCGNRLESFFDIIQDLYTHPHAGLYHHFGKTIFAHAAVHPNLWSMPDVVDDASKQLALYGEVSTFKNVNGYPTRTYDWADTVPGGCRVVVGHDRNALGKPAHSPTVYKNENGGETFFTDTGCGKEKVEGRSLTGTVFFIVDDELDFVKFIPFN